MSVILQCEKLTHIYSPGTPFEFKALDGLDLSVEKGSFTGIIGHTGSGKSTLIKHFNGLLKPTSGRVLLEGKDIWEEPKKIRSVRSRVGLVFQFPEYQIFEETVEKDIAFGPKNMGLDEDGVRRAVEHASEITGISSAMLKKSPFELSGGEKRRVAIAGVIAMSPEVLILDEPAAGLDPKGKDAILDYIGRYHREGGNTVMIVSHSMEDVSRVAERILVLDGGRMTIDGTPKEVFRMGESLKKMGLELPFVPRVLSRLAAMGIDVDTAEYTSEGAARALMSLKQRRDGNA